MITNYKRYNSLLLDIPIKHWPTDKKYYVLREILSSSYGDESKIVGNPYIFKLREEFICEIRVYFSSLIRLRVLKFNGKLDDYISGLYSQRAKTNVLMFVEFARGDVNTIIGDNLFREHYCEPSADDLKFFTENNLLF